MRKGLGTRKRGQARTDNKTQRLAHTRWRGDIPLPFVVESAVRTVLQPPFTVQRGAARAPAANAYVGSVKSRIPFPRVASALSVACCLTALCPLRRPRVQQLPRPAGSHRSRRWVLLHLPRRLRHQPFLRRKFQSLRPRWEAQEQNRQRCQPLPRGVAATAGCVVSCPR